MTKYFIILTWAIISLWLLWLPAPAQAEELPELVGEALRRNREILAARAAWQAATEVPSQAAALPDPKLGVGVMNLPTSFRFDTDMMTMKQVEVSQHFPWFGKRGLRGRAAEHEAEAARERYLETANRVIRDLKEAYYELYFVGEQTRLVEANLDVLSQFVRIAEALYATGSGKQADVLRAQTAHSRMLDERLAVERERIVASSRLASLLDRPPAAGPAPPTEPACPEPPAWEPQELLQLALAQRPMLKEAQAMTRARRARVDLARKEYWPDFELMASYGQREEVLGRELDDMLGAALMINVPLWRGSKLEPMVRESLFAEQQALEIYEASLNQVEFTLSRSLARARRAKEAVSLYDTGILPQARLTVESSLSSYQVGKLDFLSLLEAQLSLYNFEVARARALTDYCQALAEIDYTTGAPTLEGQE